MKLEEVKQKLENGKHPVVVNFVRQDHCKVFTIHFLKGMIMSDHKTNKESTLYVLNGQITFNLAGHSEQLSSYSEINIPPGLIHNIICTEDAICLLIQN